MDIPFAIAKDAKDDKLVDSLKNDDKANDPLAGLPFRSPTCPNEETHGNVSVSMKIVKYVSEKLNAISNEELQEYQQLAVLSAGGVIDSIEEKAFEERLGMNDIEESVNKLS
jgi:hypothetical protein